MTTFSNEQMLKKLGLDEKCVRILAFMAVYLIHHSEGIRYNKLFRLVNRAGIKLSKGWFDTHLTHLKKLGYVKQERKKKQHVVYHLNRGNALIIAALHGAADWRTAISIVESIKGTSPQEKVVYLADLVTMIELAKMRETVEAIDVNSRKREKAVYSNIIRFYLWDLILVRVHAELTLLAFNDAKSVPLLIEALETAMEQVKHRIKGFAPQPKK